MLSKAEREVSEGGVSVAELLTAYFSCPGEKDHVDVQLPRALVGTTRLRVVVVEIIIILCPMRTGTSGSKINDAGSSTLKLAASDTQRC